MAVVAVIAVAVWLGCIPASCLVLLVLAARPPVERPQAPAEPAVAGVLDNDRH